MSRYFLTKICVEGFRGINNEGDPLELKFKTDAVNSIYAINGTGKSSLFDALCYAICGEIPKLARLQATEKPEDYYHNKFHSTGHAIILLEFESDDPTPAKVSIQVERTPDGSRNVTSPSGHADPEAFLDSLNESFTLLDYETFSKFIDHTPLERGRSFSSLLGLAEYSDFRQTLKTAIDTRSLTADLDLNTLTYQVQQYNQRATLAVSKLEANFNSLTSQFVEDITKLDEYRQLAADTLYSIKLLAPLVKDKKLEEIDFSEVDKQIKSAEGSKERAELAGVVNSLSRLETIKDDDLSGITEEITKHRDGIDAIAELFKKTKGKLCKNLYTSAEALFNSGEWADDHICPLCGETSSASISESVAERLQDYKEVNNAMDAFQMNWNQSNLRKRLSNLETLVGGDLGDSEKLLRPYDSMISDRKLSKAEFNKVVDYYEKMETRYSTAVATFAKRKKEIEEKLPASLVTLTKQVEYARLFKEATDEYINATKQFDDTNKKLTLRKRWQVFITDAANKFAEAESELSKAKIASIETEFKDMFASVMGVNDITPNLEREENKENLQVQLSEFHGLKDVSARALLSESYRNALAISVYLSAAINHQGVPRFIVLDDITSSFDSGHQINLMEYIRTKLKYPDGGKGLQFILLSHDGIMRKYFDGQNSGTGWNHQSIEGFPPGVITTQKHDANRIRGLAENFLNAGQVDVAQPWARQYLEFTLMQIIKKLNIAVPIDFAVKDHMKMVSNCLDAIKSQVDLHEVAGTIILEPAQLNDFKNTYAPQLLANWVSHYETAAGTSISAPVMLGVLDNVDKLADCFKYDDADPSGTVTRKWYKSLTSK